MSRWMIYGANGYTGRLIADVARVRGQRPVLAGRNRLALEEQAAALDLDARVFELADMKDNLEGIGAVLLAAGPFVHTARPAVDACLLRRCHYLDITGEHTIIAELHGRDAEARAAGIAIVPGVGFDVVPTDCLAKTLADALPGATHLDLAIAGAGIMSRGTLKTVVAHLGEGGAIRRDGRIATVPLAYQTERITFSDKERVCVTIPWGDLESAYHSTGIGNIRVFMSAGKGSIASMRLARLAMPLLRARWMQARLRARIDRGPEGPDAEQRADQRSRVWGRVRRDDQSLEGTLDVQNGYSLTAESAVRATERLLELGSAGFQTPSLAFGADFILSIPGSTMHIGALGRADLG